MSSAFSIPPRPMTLEQFDELLNTLEDAYHNEERLVPDTVYDELLEEYKQLYGPRKKVGAPIRNMENKRVLGRPMPSLDKVREEKELNLWKARNPGPYVITPKVDGISIQHHEKQLSTRGSGTVGGTIDHLLPLLHMPMTARSTYVRAENVMPISTFAKKYSKEYANPRNMAGGLCNPASTSYKDEEVRDLRVLAYEFASTEPMRQSEQLVELKNRGYEPVRHECHDDVNVEQLSALLKQWREEEDYEMDGLVITRDEPYPHPLDDSLPDHAIAFKMAGESAFTIAREVEWNESKHGLLKPRVRIDPVVLDGVTITWATGHNAKFILNNRIGPGAELEVERSGTVIPYIRDVPKPAPGGAQMPSAPYQWVKRKKMAPLGAKKVPADAVVEEVDGESFHVWYVESDADICTLEETGEQRIKYLAEFLKKLDCKHVGKETVAKLYNAGYQTLTALFDLKVEDLLKIPGFQTRSAERVVESIRGGITNAPLARVAGASGVLGAGFGGERKISAVFKKIHNLLELELPFGEMCELLHTAGLQTTAAQFAERLPLFKKWLKEHPQVTVSYKAISSPVSVASPEPVHIPQQAGPSAASPQASAAAAGASLAGECVVFSGVRNKALEDVITAREGRVTTSVSGKTTILVMKATGTGSAKETSALEKGIKVMDLETFRATYQC